MFTKRSRIRLIALSALIAALPAFGSLWNGAPASGTNKVQLVDSNNNPITGPQQVEQLDNLPMAGTGTCSNSAQACAYPLGGINGQDATGYNSILIQNTGIGSGNTVVVEWSNDRTTWNAAPILALASTQQQSVCSTSGAMTAASWYAAPKAGNYVRARVSVYGSGTWTSNAVLSQTAIANCVQQTNVVGSASTDSAASGNAVQVGCINQTTAPTSHTTNGVMVPCQTDRSGAIIERPYTSSDMQWQYVAASGCITASGAVTLKAAQASGVRNYLASITLQNTSSTATEVRVNDGASGTALWRITLPASFGPQEFSFRVPKQGTAATLMEFAVTTTPTGGMVCVDASGYGAP